MPQGDDEPKGRGCGVAGMDREAVRNGLGQDGVHGEGLRFAMWRSDSQTGVNDLFHQ
jgi:hypothetical protein